MAYYKIHKFKEGGTMLFREDTTVDAVDMSIYITTGAVADEDIPGLSHFYEHMMFCDTVNRKEAEIDKKSAELHNLQNATTSLNFVGLDFCVPKRNFEESVKHNADILLNSTFPEDKIKREKDVVVSEFLMSQNEPYDIRDRLYASLLAYCYGNDNDYFTSILGTEESIRSITRQNLLDYRIKHLNRNNIVISIVGNVTYQEAKDICKKYLISKIAPRGPMYIPEVQNVYLRRNFNFIYNYAESNSSILQFAFPFVGKQNYKNALLSQFINRILSRKLYNDLRQKQGLMYSANVYDEQFANDGLKIIEIETANEKSNAVMRGIADVVGDLIKNGISEEEFLLTKQDYIDASSYGKSNFVVGKSRELYHSYINNNRVYTDKEKTDIFNTITVDDLNQYLVKIFDTEHVIVNYIGDREPEQLYTPQQIQALFMLNRFTREQLKALYNYDVPDMGCPGEYEYYDEKNPWEISSKQLLIEHFEKKKRGRKKKQPKVPKFEELSEEKRELIKNILKQEGFDLDLVSQEILKEDQEK